MKDKETVKEKAKEPSGVSKFFGDMANKTSLAAGRASRSLLRPARHRVGGERTALRVL